MRVGGFGAGWAGDAVGGHVGRVSGRGDSRGPSQFPPRLLRVDLPKISGRHQPRPRLLDHGRTVVGGSIERNAPGAGGVGVALGAVWRGERYWLAALEGVVVGVEVVAVEDGAFFWPHGVECIERVCEGAASVRVLRSGES